MKDDFETCPVGTKELIEDCAKVFRGVANGARQLRGGARMTPDVATMVERNDEMADRCEAILRDF